MVARLGHALSAATDYEGTSVVKICTIAMALEGALHCFYGVFNVHTDIFADGFRGKIFNTEIVAALGHALSNDTSYLRSSVVEFFTAAVAQGALRLLYGILIPKY